VACLSLQKRLHASLKPKKQPLVLLLVTLVKATVIAATVAYKVRTEAQREADGPCGLKCFSHLGTTLELKMLVQVQLIKTKSWAHLRLRMRCWQAQHQQHQWHRRQKMRRQQQLMQQQLMQQH
jgi:hypothetical protein